MSYLSLLVHCMVRNERFRDEYFTFSGSSHGADHLFSGHIDSGRMDANHRYMPASPGDWNAWQGKSLEQHSRDGICIMRSGWTVASPGVWQDGVNSLDQALMIISSPNTKLDWLYCWFNMVDKIPIYVYWTLQQRSKFYPNMWSRGRPKGIPRYAKLGEMVNAMPVHPLRENITVNKPTFRFMTTEMLDENFPLHLGNFLSANGIRAHLNDDIFAWHRKFASKQMPNYLRAKDLAQGHAMESRGPFDDVLLRYLADSDPWSTL